MDDSEIIDLLGKPRLRHIETVLQKAYSLGDLFVHDNSIFQIPSARSFRQNIVNLSVDYSLEMACKDEDFGFSSFYSKNKAKNCEHIELTNDTITLTHSSVQSRGGFPRDAIFRKELSYSNQLTFWKKNDFSPNYGIITHRPYNTSERLAEVMLGIPDCDYCSWANLINITEIFVQEPTIITPVSEKEYNDFQIAIKRQAVSVEDNG